MNSTKTFSLKNIDWITSVFLVVTPLISLILIPIELHRHGWHWSYLAMTVVFWMATGLSITAGYHRFLAHKSYEASKFVKILYLFVGAAAFQGSAMKWCSDHRRHHRFVDTEKDPYNIKRGFWYAHIGWLFLKTENQFEFAPDLNKDPVVMFQHRYYAIIATVMGFGIPTLVGWSLGSALGGLAFGGFLRIFVGHHCTFFINSLCHTLGRQPYSDAHSARDSFFMALLTYGEGYHNFHHQFQADYRNGIRWYHWDPTKWSIQFFALTGQAKKLKTVAPQVILQAKLLQAEKVLSRKGVPMTAFASLKERVERTQAHFRKLHDDYLVMKKQLQQKSDAKVILLRAEVKEAKQEFKEAYGLWKVHVRVLRSRKYDAFSA